MAMRLNRQPGPDISARFVYGCQMADARKVTNWIWGLAAILILLVVVAHAIAPIEDEHARGRGSAFSASTAEVSLKSGSRVAVAKDVVPLEPMEPVFALLVLPDIEARPATPPVLSMLGIASLLAETTLSPISPRAPPAV